jgi:hypothetical protein
VKESIASASNGSTEGETSMDSLLDAQNDEQDAE